MTVELKQPLPVDARQEQRTSIFVMATLYADSGSWPVKVRDLSSGGALVEGAVLPLPGSQVRLGRGALNVIGEIMWCRGGRAGLQFEASLSVDDWLPGQRVNAHQQRVDEMVQQVKSSATKKPMSVDLQRTFQSRGVSSAELTQLRLAIDSLAQDLADDSHVIARHAEKLQTLDLVAQALAKLTGER